MRIALATAQELLVIAVIAQFMIENSATLGPSTFVLGTVGLALCVGLGGQALVDPGLSVIALAVATWRMTAQHPELATVYTAVAGVMVVTYLFGRYISWTVWRVPALLFFISLGALWWASSNGRL